MTFRRPARYLNDGVPDFERDLALDGTTLLGSVKSGLLVDVVRRGTRLDEAAAAGRARIREAVTRWVGARSATSAALVTAVLIGDRAAIPDDVRDTLQCGRDVSRDRHLRRQHRRVRGAGVGAGRAGGPGPAPGGALTIGVLLAYAALVVSGPSVRRAVLVAVVYLERADHRPPGAGVARGRDRLRRCAGRVAAGSARRRLRAHLRRCRRAAGDARLSSRGLSVAPPLRALLLPMAASAAVEAVLLPVQALVFSRVTLAGIALNLVAVPMMAVAQIGGLAVVALDLVGASASWPAWAADMAVKAVLEQRRRWWRPRRGWRDRVRPPPSPVVAAYYAALAVATFARRGVRAAGIAVWVVTAAIIVAGSPEWLRDAGRGFSPAGPQPRDVPAGHLRVTMLDVGQAEAILLEPPAGAPVLIDAGGSPFGSGLESARAWWRRRCGPAA